MKCTKCGYNIPYGEVEDTVCPSCGKDALRATSEDWLSDSALGLVAEVRPGQLHLANAVEEAMESEDPQVVFIQGGCGIGKTYSYLVPSIVGRRRIVVSTAKKSLQGQLEDKDLPRLQEVIGGPKTFVSVKGKSNYLCKRLLKKEGKKLKQVSGGLVKRVEKFLADTPSGDLDKFPGGAPWQLRDYTASECVGKGCTYAKNGGCGYMSKKRSSREAEALIVNHSLLGFDLRFGPGAMFGEYDVLVIDEAHAAVEQFRNAFTRTISYKWLKKTLNKIHVQNIPYSEKEDKSAQRIWQKLFRSVPREDVLLRGFFDDQVLLEVMDLLEGLRGKVRSHMATTWSGSTNMNLKAPGVQETLSSAWSDSDDLLVCDSLSTGIVEMMRVLESTRVRPREELGQEDESEDEEKEKLFDDNDMFIREELRNGDIRIAIKPLNIGRVLGSKLNSIKTLILTSATLQPSLIGGELGLHPDVVLDEPSPFDFSTSGLVYAPKNTINPTTIRGDAVEHDKWLKVLSSEIVKLVRASNGNGLVLFTSLAELKEVVEYIAAEYELENKVIAQTDGRKADDMVAEFMASDNSVLFGSKSFFEGVDIKGAKLRLVVLTKLPFPIWGDAIVQAKKKQMGPDFFKHYYLLKMFTDLSQAAGRLIRTKNDKGVFAILDPRIWTGGSKTVTADKVRNVGGRWSGYGHEAYAQTSFEHITHLFSQVDQFLKHIQK